MNNTNSQILIDTSSIGHSIRRAHPSKKLDYAAYIEYLTQKYYTDQVLIFVDENAKSFVRYLEPLGCTLIKKKPHKKRIGPLDKIWYLSFAVELALYSKVGWNLIIVTSDVEAEPVCNYFGLNVHLHGVGVPLSLRENVGSFNNIPDTFIN